MRKVVFLNRFGMERLAKAGGPTKTVQVQGYTRSDGAFVQAHQATVHGSAEVPDEHKPEHAFNTLSSRDLGKIASGKVNLKDHAHHALASRRLDVDGEDINAHMPNGGNAGAFAKLHHEGHMSNDGEGFKPDASISDHMQPWHTKVLSGIAKGHVDPVHAAKKALANRGHDTNGKWVGFEAANRLHGVDGASGSAPAKAEKPRGTIDVSALKHGAPLYDKHGNKADEVHSVVPRRMGNGHTVHTRAGYEVHVGKDGANSMGWSHKKPGA